MVGRDGRCRHLRLAVVAVLFATAGGGGAAGALPVAATSNCSAPPGRAPVTVALNGSPTTISGRTGDTSATQYICVSGTPTGTAVLDLTATRSDSSSTDFFLCLDGIPDTSDLGATRHVRTTHVTGSPKQRTAIATPLAQPEYRVRVRSVGTGSVSAFGCGGALFGPRMNFDLTISYHDSPAASAGNGFSFAVQNLPDPGQGNSQSRPGAGEPSIAVDRLHGDRVYVSAPVGVPSGAGCLLNQQVPIEGGCGGVNFWFSTDGGRTFTFCNASDPNGGGDSHVAVDTTGSIYSADLAASNLDTQKGFSSGGAPPVLKAGRDCGLTNTGPTGLQSDRQWLATYLPDPSKGTDNAKVFLSYHDLTAELPQECVGISGGRAYLPSCTPMISETEARILADAAGNTINGNQVFDSQGVIYSIFGTSTAPDNAPGLSGKIHNLYLARSGDGVAFTNRSIFIGTPQNQPGGSDAVSVANIFPVIAIDRRDNLYAVWSEQPARGGASVIKLTSSTDKGDTWSEPVVVNSGALHSNVLPWVVAGDDGKVDVVWVGSTATSSDDVSADWNIYMAQTLNGHAQQPTFLQTRVTQQPVRYANICFKGLACVTDGDDGRILLDFVSVELDSQCRANIAFANSGPDTSGFSDVSGFVPFTAYARQTAGPALCTPATTSGGSSTATNGSGNAAPNAAASTTPFSSAPPRVSPALPLAAGIFGLVVVLGLGFLARRLAG